MDESLKSRIHDILVAGCAAQFLFLRELIRTPTNLVVRHEFASGPVVALNAHGDTGPAGNGWTAKSEIWAPATRSR